MKPEFPALSANMLGGERHQANLLEITACAKTYHDPTSSPPRPDQELSLHQSSIA
jgi:hypothetical protein